MIIGHENNVTAINLKGDLLDNVTKKVLVSPENGWHDYVMRLFELGENGYTPRHRHDWPHINYVAHGSGILFLEGDEHPLQEGSFAYVPAGKEHQFINRGKETFALICIVPAEGEQ